MNLTCAMTNPAIETAIPSVCERPRVSMLGGQRKNALLLVPRVLVIALRVLIIALRARIIALSVLMIELRVLMIELRVRMSALRVLIIALRHSGYSPLS